MEKTYTAGTKKPFIILIQCTNVTVRYTDRDMQLDRIGNLVLGTELRQLGTATLRIYGFDSS